MGEVVINQIPMIMSFDEEEVEYICQILAENLRVMYSQIDPSEYE
jgi:hypothetical protein